MGRVRLLLLMKIKWIFTGDKTEWMERGKDAEVQGVLAGNQPSIGRQGTSIIFTTLEEAKISGKGLKEENSCALTKNWWL